MIKYQIFTRALEIAKWRLERNKGQEWADLDWEICFLSDQKILDTSQKGVKRWKKEGSKPSYCFNVTCKSLGFYILLFYLKYKTVLFAEIVLTLFWCKISFYDCVAFILGPQ